MKTLDLPLLPKTSAHGALIEHITGGHLIAKKSFQPMNVNFGLFPPVEIPTHDEDGKKIKGKQKSIARKLAHIASEPSRIFRNGFALGA